MSYLVKKDNENLTYVTLMNDNLCYKYLSNKINNRLIPITRNASNHYSVILDDKNQMQIIYKSKDHKIVHLKEDNLNYQRNILLDDASNTYNISNIRLIHFKHHLYLFYTANNPYDSTFDLIFHQIDDETATPQSLLSLTHLNSPYDITICNNKMYLNCITKDEQYELGLYVFDPDSKEWVLEQILKSQSNPLTYTSFCKDDMNALHIVYMSEQFGQNQLCYINTLNKQSKTLHTSPYKLEPIVFKYKDYLWINWLENKINKLVFSITNGDDFSDVTKCSLQQDNLEKINFINNHPNLFGSNYYGVVGSSIPVISILSQIDLENALLNQNTNRELNLLISQLQSKSTSDSIQSANIEELDYLKDIQENIKEQYNELAEFARQLQEEGKKWKSKYLKTDMELKKIKEEYQLLKAKQEKIASQSLSNSEIKDIEKGDSLSTNNNNMETPS